MKDHAGKREVATVIRRFSAILASFPAALNCERGPGTHCLES